MLLGWFKWTLETPRALPVIQLHWSTVDFGRLPFRFAQAVHFKSHAFPPDELPHGQRFKAGPFLDLDEDGSAEILLASAPVLFCSCFASGDIICDLLKVTSIKSSLVTLLCLIEVALRGGVDRDSLFDLRRAAIVVVGCLERQKNRGEHRDLRQWASSNQFTDPEMRKIKVRLVYCITVLASTTVELHFFTLFSFRLIRSLSAGSI